MNRNFFILPLWIILLLKFTEWDLKTYHDLPLKPAEQISAELENWKFVVDQLNNRQSKNPIKSFLIFHALTYATKQLGYCENMMAMLKKVNAVIGTVRFVE